MRTQKIILDCDNTMGLPLKEVDDGLTLLYLLGRPELNLLGITTTFGNGTLDQVYLQTHDLAHTLKLKIPVLKGLSSKDADPDTPAARFLVETVRKHPGEITLLAIGPLGNLGAAATLDPNFFGRLKGIVTMGGYTSPLKLGFRNLPELNFSACPEASLAVLNGPCPVTVMTGQACLTAAYTLHQINQAGWWPPRIRRILRRWLLAFGAYCGVPHFYLWDLLPAVYLTDSQIFDQHTYRLGSSLADMHTGTLIKTEISGAPELNLPTGINSREVFFNILENSWRRCARDFDLTEAFKS